MTDAVLDFKAALLKSQPCAATANVFKPSTGDGSTDGKEQDAGPTAPSNASGDDGRGSSVKVRCPKLLFPVWGVLMSANQAHAQLLSKALLRRQYTTSSGLVRRQYATHDYRDGTHPTHEQRVSLRRVLDLCHSSGSSCCTSSRFLIPHCTDSLT